MKQKIYKFNCSICKEPIKSKNKMQRVSVYDDNYKILHTFAHKSCYKLSVDAFTQAVVLQRAQQQIAQMKQQLNMS